MFQQINFKGLAKSELFAYAKALPFFKGRRTLDFKPGLNILFGPNGSGKSTALNILAQTMAAQQGGSSTVTEDLVSSTVDMLSRIRAKAAAKAPTGSMRDKLGLAVVHDGQPVLYADPRKAVGLAGGAFDYDFLRKGIVEASGGKRISHGQLSLGRTNDLLAVLAGHTTFPPEIDCRLRKTQLNDLWREAIGVVEARMAATIEKGQPTVLLDEPEANFSLIWQNQLWNFLSRKEVARDFQLIVASHSPFALGIPHANYIELEEGYASQAEAALMARFGAKA